LKQCGYKIYFWSNEFNEPIHVHISKGKPIENSTKIWLTKSGGCIVANNKSGIPTKELREILETISYNYLFIISAWKEYFKQEEIKFYC
jgi:hypothetical protein